LGIKPGPVTPEGISARTVDGRTLYVNSKNVPVTVTFEGTKTAVLSRKSHTGKIELPAFGVELLE
jgi:beta-galactosidase